MKLALLVYLASISEKVSFIFGSLAAAIFFIFAFILFFSPIIFDSDSVFRFKKQSHFGLSADEAKEHNDSVLKNRGIAKKWSIRVAVMGLVFALTSALIPSEKTIYIMAGAYATEQIANSDRVQKIGSDVLEVIESKLSKMKEDN